MLNGQNDLSKKEERKKGITKIDPSKPYVNFDRLPKSGSLWWTSYIICFTPRNPRSFTYKSDVVVVVIDWIVDFVNFHVATFILNEILFDALESYYHSFSCLCFKVLEVSIDGFLNCVAVWTVQLFYLVYECDWSYFKVWIWLFMLKMEMYPMKPKRMWIGETMHCKPEQMQQKATLNVVDYSDPFAIHDLLESLDTANFRTKAKEIEVLCARKMQMLHPYFVMYVSLPFMCSDWERSRAKGLQTEWMDRPLIWHMKMLLIWRMIELLIMC